MVLLECLIDHLSSVPQLLLSLVLKLNLFLFVNEALLTLDVLKHVLAFWQYEVVWKNSRILLIELSHLGKSNFGLLLSVEALEELTDIIVDQVVFEDRYQPRRFVVYYVINDLCIVVVPTRHVLLAQGFSDEPVLGRLGFRRDRSRRVANGAFFLREVKHVEKQVAVALQLVGPQAYLGFWKLLLLLLEQVH